MHVTLKTKPKALPKLTFTQDDQNRIIVEHERYCGVCLFEHVTVVRLNADGLCPTCGADYGKA